MEEIWKPVPSKPGVLASSFGRILFPRRKRLMPNGGIREYITKPSYGGKRYAKKGYKYCYMAKWNTFYGNVKIHQAVCEAFHGPKPFPGAIVLHLDEDSANNRPENVKWGTQKENLNAPGYLLWAQSDEKKSKIVRKTHCKHGHEYTAENTMRTSIGGRTCRECSRARDRLRDPVRRPKKSA